MNLKYKVYTTFLALACGLVINCSDEDFVDANKNPDILATVAPENQFISATLSIHSQDFEAFYDFYRRIMPWMQYVTPQNGNGVNFTDNVANFSNRYGRLYTGVGDALTDLEKLVEKLPAEDQPRYVHMINVSRILKAYYTFYVSDIYGSIPYTEAWQGRYGGTLQPTYDSQQDLFAKLDSDIKAAIGVLKTQQPVTQVSLGNFDQYYRGDIPSWIRAANALRLKIATRLIKRDAGKVQSIAQEVLSVPGDLMSENNHGWVLRANSSFVEGGNWNPDLLYATKPLVDFMWDNEDPRLDAFFAPNGYSQDTINILINEGKLKAGTMQASRRYFGSFTSPDDASATVNAKYYSRRTATVAGTQRLIDTLSLIQRRLFQPSFNEMSATGGAGNGNVFLPVITYAEFCFIRAELAARDITNEDPKEFYDKGVTSSIQWYDQLAREGKLIHYSSLAPSEISDYLTRPGIEFDPAIALDQIASQAFLHFYKQPAEGWALWKRTGMPNTTTVLALTDMKTNGSSLRIPRRAPLSLLNTTSSNYENQKAAYDAMAQIPGFGSSPTDAFGRVWWDMP